MMGNLFLESFGFFTAGVFLHLPICRWHGSRRFAFRSIAFFLIYSVPICWFLGTRPLSEAICVYLMAGLLWNCYVIFLINLQNSITLQLLCFLARCGDRSITPDRLEIEFSSSNCIGNRFDAMRRNHFVACDPQGRYTLTPSGKRVARLISVMRRALSMPQAQK
jgi:hypothetical protein